MIKKGKIKIMNDNPRVADTEIKLPPRDQLALATNHWLDLLTEQAELHVRIYDDKGHYRGDYSNYTERNSQVRRELRQAEQALKLSEYAAESSFSRPSSSEAALVISGVLKEPRRNEKSLFQGKIMTERVTTLQQQLSALGEKPDPLQQAILKRQIGAISKHFESSDYPNH